MESIKNTGSNHYVAQSNQSLQSILSSQTKELILYVVEHSQLNQEHINALLQAKDLTIIKQALQTLVNEYIIPAETSEILKRAVLQIINIMLDAEQGKEFDLKEELNFVGADFTNLNNTDTSSLFRLNLSNAKISSSVFLEFCDRTSNYHKPNLSGVIVIGDISNLLSCKRITLNGATLVGKYEKIGFIECDFTNSKLENAHFVDCRFTRCTNVPIIN